MAFFPASSGSGESQDVSSSITVKITGASVKAYKSGNVVFLSYMGNTQAYTSGTVYEILEIPSELRPKTDFNTLGIGTTANTSIFAVYFAASTGKVSMMTSDTTSRRCAFGVCYLI